MKVPQCEECADKRKQLEENPKGGCAKCEFHDLGDKSGPCRECMDTYTPWNHYPRFSPLKEEEILLTELVEEEEEL